MNNRKNVISNSGWIDLALRLFLGGLFIYASYHKILDPAAFARSIYGYDLFPATAINLIAIVLPFLELICGMALCMGVWPRSAVLLIGGMLLAFIVAIAINLARGHVFDCGCFSATGGADPASARNLLMRDILYLAMAIHVWRFSGKRRLSRQ